MSSRREFLFQIALIALLPAGTRVLAMTQAPSALSGLTREELELLEVVVDEMIPAGEGMPSAAAAGGVAYLQQLSWQYPDILGELEKFLQVLRQMSQTKFAADFKVLRADQRVAVLTDIEKQAAPKLFPNIIGYVYEAYYSQPRVLGLISCARPSITSDEDQELLAPVRNMRHVYREVR